MVGGTVTQERTTMSRSVRDHNIGTSDYATHRIQPWDIWLEYGLNPWDADIVKRVLRKKEGDSRTMDYEKIIHICEERIRQLAVGREEGEKRVIPTYAELAKAYGECRKIMNLMVEESDLDIGQGILSYLKPTDDLVAMMFTEDGGRKLHVD